MSTEYAPTRTITQAELLAACDALGYTYLGQPENESRYAPHMGPVVRIHGPAYLWACGDPVIMLERFGNNDVDDMLDALADALSVTFAGEALERHEPADSSLHVPEAAQFAAIDAMRERIAELHARSC